MGVACACDSQKACYDVCTGSSCGLILGRPTFAVVTPGHCVLSGGYTPCKLLNRHQHTHNTLLLDFSLPDLTQSLQLPTCACIVVKLSEEELRRQGLQARKGSQVRPYTPISTNALLGHFRLLLKVYETGLVSKYMASLAVGATANFSHLPVNVKIQYPFKASKIAMLAGGTGITPMVQALHAILGNPEDKTQVVLIYGSHCEDDIILHDDLGKWRRTWPEKLQVIHVLPHANCSEKWQGEKGHMDETMIKKYCPGPKDDVLVFVCGPPPMYSSLCGPRDTQVLSGALKKLGYSETQVVKF